jgi:hypothetical protein
VGFVGLPPEGATPSAPESGELVASLWSHIRLDPVWGTGELFLYADGRVIWTRRDGRSLGEGANEHSTGFLEQPLTPEGIELVRSEILATGLFDSDSPPPDDVDGSLRVGVQGEDGTWRVNAQESALDQEQSDALLQLAQRLRYLESWLPAGAWKHREITAYVPSRFALEVDVHTDTGEVLSPRATVSESGNAQRRRTPRDLLPRSHGRLTGRSVPSICRQVRNGRRTISADLA